MRRVTNYRESDQIISNPFMGFQSCDKAAPNSVWPSQTAYCKYYWRDHEKSMGVFNFNYIMQQLKEAEAKGQKFFPRIMGSDERTSFPGWMKTQGIKGTHYMASPDDSPTGPQWTADFSDLAFAERHLMFVQALYDHLKANNRLQNVEAIDIGIVGLWGEWHFSGTTPEIKLPSMTAGKRVIDAWQKTFLDIQSFVQITAPEFAAYAISKGAGWRGDGWGEPNHQNRYYPGWLKTAGAEEAWKKAPVALESFGTVKTWTSRGWNVKANVDWALDVARASYINVKDWNIPTLVKPEIERLCKRIGYRLLVPRIEYDDVVDAGAEKAIKLRIINKGCAPTYAPIKIILKLGSSVLGSTSIIPTFELQDFVLKYKVPRSMASGMYSASLATELKGSQVELASDGQKKGKDLIFGSIRIL